MLAERFMGQFACRQGAQVLVSSAAPMLTLASPAVAADLGLPD